MSKRRGIPLFVITRDRRPISAEKMQELAEYIEKRAKMPLRKKPRGRNKRRGKV